MNYNFQLIQPLIYAALSDSISDYAAITKPAVMNIYEFTINPSESHDLSFIPSPYCEWIIGYNELPEDSIFCCIGPASQLKTITLPHYEHYIGIRFNDDVYYISKSASSLPANLRDQFFQYTPLPDSYEYQLISKFTGSADFSQRLSYFEEFLFSSKKMCSIPENVHDLFEQLKRSNGSISVAELANQSGYSNRHICRIITEEFGYGPKEYCKYIRFQKALFEIISNPKRSNSEFIQNIGYSDQAHFQREFKLFMGITPKQFIHMLSH